jgi:hypothetical protein
MTIVFGHNNFLLKSVAPVEIGLIDKSFNNYKFEQRQKYGHLFWIPFIPLGKIWVVKKPDGKLYQCPLGIETDLQQRYPARTSIWAWTGPLLIMAGLLIYTVNDKIERYSNEKYNQERLLKDADILAEKVKAIGEGDYLVMSVKESGNGYYENEVPLKVIKVNTDSVTVGRITIQYMGTNNSNLSDLTDAERYNSQEDLARLELRNGIMGKFSISKKVLQDAICKEYGGGTKFAGAAIQPFTNQGNCMLINIIHQEGPLLKQVTLNSEKRDDKYYEFENKGFGVTADSIITFKKDDSWQISKERDFEYGSIIAIKCNTKDSAILYTSNKQKQVFKTKIDNTEYSLKISAMEK